jgi:SAM-dependent methyltransferase
MVTISPEPSPSSRPEPHQARQIAESFGVDAERYDRARPRYPDALVERIAAAGHRVLDVGCGTGIEARQLQAAGCTVLGVEPDVRMAEVARRRGLDVEVARIEEWDPAGREFDAVAAGQSWHWVDPVAGAAKAARALRPGGLLTAFWHVYEPPPAVAEALAGAYRTVVPDSPFRLGQAPATAPYETMMTTAADGFARAGGFGAAERWRFEEERTYTSAQWVDLIATTGGLTRLPAERLAVVTDAVAAAVEAIGGAFTLPFTTLAVAAVRAG